VHAGLDDDARLGESGGDVGGTTQHTALADDLLDLADAVDSILERQHDRMVAGHDVKQRQRLLVAVGLDREDDEIHGPDPFAALLELTLDAKLAERAFDGETAGPHRGQMRTACNEDDIVPGTRHLCAVITAHGA